MKINEVIIPRNAWAYVTEFVKNRVRKCSLLQKSTHAEATWSRDGGLYRARPRGEIRQSDHASRRAHKWRGRWSMIVTNPTTTSVRDGRDQRGFSKNRTTTTTNVETSSTSSSTRRPTMPSTSRRSSRGVKRRLHIASRVIINLRNVIIL